MAYKIRWKKKGATYESNKTFKSKVAANKKVRFIRQMDDDLRVKDRDKSLKTYRVVKTIPLKKVKKRK